MKGVDRFLPLFLLPLERGAPKGQRLASALDWKGMGGKRFLVSSSRAQPRDLFRLPFAVFLRKSICMKHRDPQSHEAYGVSRSPLPSQLLPDRERKRFLASARNDDAGKAAFSLLPLEGGGAAMEVGFALIFLRPTPCPSGIPLPREGGRWATHPASPSFLWKEVARSARGWLRSLLKW